MINRLELNTRVNRLIVSNNERSIAGSADEGRLFVWNAATGKERWHVDVRTGVDRRDQIFPAAFSPDDRWLVCTVDNSLRIFHTDSGREKFRSDAHKVVEGRIFSPDGRWLVAFERGVHRAGKCAILDVASGAVAAEFAGESGGRPSFDTSGRRIATCHSNGMIRVWNWDGRRVEEENSWQATDRLINEVAFSTDGSRLVSSDRKNAVKVWSVVTGKLLSKLESRGEVYGVEFRPRSDDRMSDDEQIMMGTVVDGIRFWRWRSSELGQTIEALEGAVDARFSPEGQSILASTPAYFTGGNTYNHRRLYYPAERAAVLNVESGAIVRTEGAVYAASWTLDGNEIIATPASGDTTSGDAIRTYDVQTGRATSRRYPGHTGRITISRFSASDGRLISFSNDQTIRAFDFESGEEVLRRKIGPRFFGLYAGTAADFSPNAGWIGLNGAIWAAQSGSRIALREPPPGYWPKRIVFSNDGTSVYLGYKRRARNAV